MHADTHSHDEAVRFEDLPPGERRVAEEILDHMPDGPGPRDPRATRRLVAAISLVAVASVVAIVASVGRDLSAVGAIVLLIGAYLCGLLPWVGVGIMRRHDRMEAAHRAHDGAA